MAEFSIIKRTLDMLYAGLLRGTLKRAINDPDKEWDDVMMTACDTIFNCNK